MKKRFVIIGCAGYIAPRHLKAIKDTNNLLVAALDKSDSVGIIDRFFEDAAFFTEFERFDRHLEKLRRKNSENKIDYVSVCSPNYLHDAHIRFAFRLGADAICEKPLVLNPWNLNQLEELEKETGRKVYGILQLRLHPSIIELKDRIDKGLNKSKYDVDLKYVTSRGKWYLYSWKGDLEKSGGVATNLGIHFFDALIWIFGNVEDLNVEYLTPTKAKGTLIMEKAKVNWFLSINKEDLPEEIKLSGRNCYRSLKLNGEEIEFSQGFEDLHTKSYEEILNGNGFTIKDMKPSIELVHKIRNPIYSKKFNEKTNNNLEDYYAHESSSIDSGTSIGEGTKIWHFSHVLTGSKIGKNCTIGQNVMIGPEVSIGNFCKIQNNVSLFKGVSFEDNVFCGPSVTFTNVVTPRAFIDRKKEFRETKVKEGATMGANSTIICGNSIGKYSLIGAGSVVTKNVPDYARFLGTPGKQSGWVCKCGVILSRDNYSENEKILICPTCKNIYKHFKDRFTPLEENIQ